ncbi:MAG: ATP-binding protein [Pseudomonadales bacterium]
MIDYSGMRLRPTAAAELLQRTPWAETPLGVPGGWSQALKTAVQICLNAPFPMSLAWGRQHVLFYNDGYLPIMGAKHPSGFGRPALDVYSELEGFLAPRISAVFDGGAYQEQDLLLPLERDGAVREAYFTFSYSPVPDVDGVVRGMLSVASETTCHVQQRRRGETISRLADALARQAHMAPLAPVIAEVLAANPMDFAAAAMLEVSDPDHIEVRWSNANGFAAEAAAAAGPLAAHLRHPHGPSTAAVSRLDTRSFAMTLLDREVLGGNAFALVVRPDPQVPLDEGYLQLLTVLHETVSGAIYRIAEQRRALSEVRRRLNERDRLYRLLFEQSRDGIILGRTSGEIVAANPAACQLLGYSEAELIALGRDGIVVKDDARFHAMAERQQTGRFVGVLHYRRGDGTVLKADASSTRIDDAAIGNDATIVLLRDASQRLSGEERMATTARLEAIGQLTGGISHDFNNLLNVIINGAEELVAGLDGTHPHRHAADLVLAASLKAADLTRQLLAFSRQQPMATRRMDVRDGLSEVDQIVARAVGGSIAVRFDLPEGIVVRADPSLLQSAVINLAINARDAMPDGGVLTIGAAAVEVDARTAVELDVEPAEYVRVVVTDTGIGIPPDQLPRVMEPFFTTKPPGAGTGLGLSMVYGFVRQSGGGMRLRSQPGQGTTVELYLPTAANDLPDTAPALPQPTPSGAARVGGSHVLVVEDNDLLGAMVRRTLEQAGYPVTLCDNAQSALDRVAVVPGIDLVITDIQLGGDMDGWTLADRIAEQRPGLTVLTMSGFAPQTDGRGTRTPTLRKPFRPRDLLALVSSHLGSASAT